MTSRPQEKIRSVATFCGKSLLALTLTLACAYPVSSQTAPADDATAKVAAVDKTDQDYKANVRRLVKEGKLNACVTDKATVVADRPRLVFHNNCDAQVNVSLCVRVEGEPRSYFLILMSKRSEAQQVLWIEDGVRYEYKYNSCDKPYCTPPEADC